MRTFMTASRAGMQPRLRVRGALVVAALISVLVPSTVTAQPTANSQAQTSAPRSFLDEGLTLASAARGGAHPLRVDERFARVLKDRTFAFMWEVRDSRGTYYLVLHRGRAHASLALATIAPDDTVNYELWTFASDAASSRVSSPRIGSFRLDSTDGGLLCDMFWNLVGGISCSGFLGIVCGAAVGLLGYYACNSQDNYPPSAYLGWYGYPRGLTERPPIVCQTPSPDCASLQATVNLYASPSPCLTNPVDPIDQRCYYTVLDQTGRPSVQPVSVIWTWGAQWPDGAVTTTATPATPVNSTSSFANRDITTCCPGTFFVHAYLDCIVIVPPAGYSVPQDSVLATQCGDLPVGGSGYATGAIEETYVCCSPASAGVMPARSTATRR